MRNSRLLLPLIGGVAAGLTGTALALEPPSGSVEDELRELRQKIDILERKLEVEKEAKEAEKAKQTATVEAGPKGFAIKSTDGAHTLKLRGLLHADGRFYFGGEGTDSRTGRTGGNDDTFLLRRVRPILEGTVFNIFDFRFMPDFGGGNTVIQDAWVDARFFPWAQLLGGKFKTPFGIERLQSASAIRFVERALPNNLVPNRDLGVELHGDLWNGAVSYAAAWLNGVSDGGSSDEFGDFDSNVDKDAAARLFVHPFLNSDIVPLQGLGLGAAVSFVDASGNPTAPNLPRYKTPAQRTFFQYRFTEGDPSNTIADGDRLRISPQAYYYYGPFGLLGEYVTVSQEVSRVLATGVRRDELDHDAWQVAASYVLTGEASTFKGVTPKSPFSIDNRTWGALELVGRYSELNIDEDTFSGGGDSFADPTRSAQEAAAWAVGFNWYLNQNLKLVLDYEQTSFEGGGGGTADAPEDREDEQALLSRIQLAF